MSACEHNGTRRLIGAGRSRCDVCGEVLRCTKDKHWMVIAGHGGLEGVVVCIACGGDPDGSAIADLALREHPLYQKPPRS